MSQTVFAIHTSFALVKVLGDLFAEILPGVRIVNVVDDSLLEDVRIAGHLIPSVTRRIAGYGVLAQSAGANAIFNCCSSVGEAADALAQTVDIPVVKIDDRMATLAVEQATRIGVIATVPTTLDPTARLVQSKADVTGKQISIRRYLVHGAFDALMSGDTSGHDAMVSEAIERSPAENDAVVLAQGSMARLVPGLKDKVQVPLLSSPRLGVEALKAALELS